MGSQLQLTSPASAAYVAGGALQGPTFCKVDEDPCPQESFVLEPKFQLDTNFLAPFYLNLGFGGVSAPQAR